MWFDYPVSSFPNCCLLVCASTYMSHARTQRGERGKGDRDRERHTETQRQTDIDKERKRLIERPGSERKREIGLFL